MGEGKKGDIHFPSKGCPGASDGGGSKVHICMYVCVCGRVSLIKAKGRQGKRARHARLFRNKAKIRVVLGVAPAGPKCLG